MDSPYTVRVSGHPQLFLDDRCVARTTNLARCVQQPVKFEGNPVIRADHPWERVHVYRPSVIYEPQLDRFRMHYTAISGPKRLATCRAESDDGFHWRKPLGDEIPFEEQPSNIRRGPAHCIRTGDPRRPYIGVFNKDFVNGRFEGRGCSVAVSEDGDRWGAALNITQTKCDTVPSIVWHEPAKRYFVYTRAQAFHPRLEGHVRITGVMSSEDFEQWTPKYAFNLVSEEEGFPYVQVHALTAHAYGDVLIGEVPIFHLEESGNNFLARCEIQLATSRDGWHWQRVAGRGVFLPHGPEDWDRWYVHSTSMTRKGDTLYFYFNGRAQKHGALRQLREQHVGIEMPGPESTIGVATLPADRFVFFELAEPNAPGMLDTPPLRFDGRDLVINALSGPMDLQVELFDVDGAVIPHQATPLEGFERACSRLVRKDDLRYRVIWTSDGAKRTLGDAPAGKPVALRFHLDQSRLYAFQVE
ncbi:MAG: hypothetical protein CMJ18_23745 [Phycisphaeraceae bacterium]|nr:hypothetical protein [Phycisphaeraceae bacterium]